MSKGKRIGYKRVSTIEQNTDRQLEGIELDKIFIEKFTGRVLERPQLQAMLDYVREDDVIVVHSLDRLGRNMKDLLKIVDALIEKKVSVEFVKENLKLTGDDSPMSKLLFSLLGSFAEFEYSFSRERQREGIAIAKKAGKYKGGKRKLTCENVEYLKKALQYPVSRSKLAQELKVSRPTIYKYEREIKQQQQQAV
jgi:DNA invertase Pin-like site-specific DNA recombinase